MTTQPQPTPPEVPAFSIPVEVLALTQELLSTFCPEGYDPEEAKQVEGVVLRHVAAIIARHAREACPPPAKDSGNDMTGAGLIAKERARQLSKGDWTPEHDDLHTAGDLRVQAAMLACEGTDASVFDALDRTPWNIKERDEILRLAVSGALIAAEIDRLIRKDSALSSRNPESVAPPAAARDGVLLDWRPASVAATWPEGSGVLYRTPYSGKSYPFLYEAHSWHRPDLMGEPYFDAFQFLLLNPPKGTK